MSWAKTKTWIKSFYTKYLIQPFEKLNRGFALSSLVFFVTAVLIVVLRFIGSRAFFHPNGDLVFDGLWALADYVEFGIWAMPFIWVTLRFLLTFWGVSVLVGQVWLAIKRWRDKKQKTIENK